MTGNEQHKFDCLCPWCKGKEDDKSDKYDHAHLHIKNMSRSKCEDELASIRQAIIFKVQKLSEGWNALMVLNRRKEEIQTRLAETGVDLRNQ